MIIRILTTAGSILTIGFGIWHFFVPKIWHWHTYIDSKATELMIAIQAINIFFSLSLVLIGLMDIIIIWSSKSNKFTILIVLSVSIILWVTRSILQIVYPQGSINPFLQYSMLFAFLIVTVLYITSFALVSIQNSM